jgi:hypothetical protein
MEIIMIPLAFDLETSLGDKKLFGPSSKDLNNDFYSIQWATHPDDVQVRHMSEGFGRLVPVDFAYELNKATIIIGHNIAFDLGYIWHIPQWQAFMRRGGEIWCTAQAEYLMSGQRHKFPSLAELQEIYLGEKVKESRISYLFKKGIGPDKILTKRNKCTKLFSLYDKYCQGDVSTTLRIFKAQWLKAKAMGE